MADNTDVELIHNRNISIHISDRSHMNISLNIYNCGNQDITREITWERDYYVFYYVKEGSGYITARQSTHKVKEGEGFVVFPNTPLVIKPEFKKNINVTWVAFSGYLVDLYLERAKLSAYEPVFQDTPEREMEVMFDQLQQESMRMPNRYCKIMAQLYSMFAFLLDHVRTVPQTVPNSPEQFLLRALDFIDSNYYDDITVEDIAANSGGNRKFLYTVFKNLTGFSPRDYLICYRMRKATSLLKDPNLSVEAVASSVGYQDQFHFSKEFKKNVGMSPTEYRRVIAKDPSQVYCSPIDRVLIQFPGVSGEGE